MRLKRTTRVNGIMFFDNNTNAVVNTSDLNISFNNYLKDSGNPNGINVMYNFDYIKGTTLNQNGNVFTIYHYTDDRYNCSFIELK